jgi:SAM-dependent MidA family methyltransferase
MSKLAEIIAEEVQIHGAIPFARFMELALYCPVYGYYEKEGDTVGKRGDYYTSASVGGLFGELLGFQFAEWLSDEPEVQYPKSKVEMVEAGAHRGDLANDILTWMERQRPELLERLEYWIIEPSDRRRQWQERTLKRFLPQVRWAASLGALADPGVKRRSAIGLEDRAELELGAPRMPAPPVRMVFSNELLDAMPVRRLGWDTRLGAWFEWGVALEHGRFVWTRMELESEDPKSTDASGDKCRGSSKRARQAPRATHHAVLPVIPNLPYELYSRLPDGFTFELCPAAEAWWLEAARTLTRGKLLTIDYGLIEEEFLLPGREKGTLRSYYRHQPGDGALESPGEQDLTAHVNFTRIQAAGESAGLKTETFASQAQFLTGILARVWKNETSFGTWTSERTRQFQTLTHPDHLGRAFRVLTQSRGKE